MELLTIILVELISGIVDLLWPKIQGPICLTCKFFFHPSFTVFFDIENSIVFLLDYQTCSSAHHFSSRAPTLRIKIMFSMEENISWRYYHFPVAVLIYQMLTNHITLKWIHQFRLKMIGIASRHGHLSGHFQQFRPV